MSLNIWCRGRNVIWSPETNFLFNLTSRQSRQLCQRKLILQYLTIRLFFLPLEYNRTSLSPGGYTLQNVSMLQTILSLMKAEASERSKTDVQHQGMPPPNNIMMVLSYVSAYFFVAGLLTLTLGHPSKDMSQPCSQLQTDNRRGWWLQCGGWRGHSSLQSCLSAVQLSAPHRGAVVAVDFMSTVIFHCNFSNPICIQLGKLKIFTAPQHSPTWKTDIIIFIRHQVECDDK